MNCRSSVWLPLITQQTRDTIMSLQSYHLQQNGLHYRPPIKKSTGIAPLKTVSRESYSHLVYTTHSKTITHTYTYTYTHTQPTQIHHPSNCGGHKTAFGNTMSSLRYQINCDRVKTQKGVGMAANNRVCRALCTRVFTCCHNAKPYPMFRPFQRAANTNNDAVRVFDERTPMPMPVGTFGHNSQTCTV